MVLRRLLAVPAGARARSIATSVRWAPTKALRAATGTRDRLPDDRQDVALTFDDGPDPQFTPAVLDVLAEHRLRATFFVVGRRVRRHPAIVERIADEGHVLGSHSFSHPDARRLTVRRLHADYADGRAALEDVVGAPVPLFRPPNGTLDLKGAAVVGRLALTPWLWSVDPADWHPDTDEDQIVERCRAATGGDVVLLHDGLERPLARRALDRSPTVRALPRIIAELQAAGRSLGTISP
jgi:peptidoglycan/xylan/chitin deacetylase (PgdA/CDA1 family)